MKNQVILHDCPEVLYKFTGHYNFFENAELRVSPIHELNDPFEGMPVIEHLWTEDDFISDYDNKLNKLANQSSIKEYGLEKLRADAKKDPKFVYKTLKEAISKSDLSSLINNFFIKDNISVLSLTSCNNNELMWSFYADGHKGFAIGLKSNHQIFSDCFWDDQNLTVGLREVQYAQQRKRFYLETNDGFCIDTLLYKSKSWEYEKEWRLIISNTEKLHTKENLSGFFSVPDDAISEIILGYRADINHIEDAKKFCKKRNILLKKEVINKEQYKIDITNQFK